MSGRKPSPMQERIYELHREDCFLCKAEIARRLVCSDKYVAVVFSRLKLRVGTPPLSPEEMSRKSLHVNGWREALARPIPFKPKVEKNQECKLVVYLDGHAVECGAPTNGRTYCPKCEARRSVQPTGSRYAQFAGPAFGMSRKMGAAA